VNTSRGPADDARERQTIELFELALEQPTAQRDAWLDARCVDDAPLRDAVRRLQAADAGAGGFLGGTFTEPALHATIGRRIGAYRLDALIAEGGMGAVYRAHRDDGAYEQTVAVKFIRQALLDREAIARFGNERRILAQLHHPNIAQILDGGTSADGTPFVVMEYVDGEPVTTYCQHLGLDARARLDLFRQVCAAVQAAHRNLVVHRDLKPANILVGADGVPKLLDFGIAKVLQPDGADAATSVALTPSYASPEQVQRRVVGIASDVYSLGVLLYVLLVDRLPYDLGDVTAAEAERLICETQPPPPSEALARAGGDARRVRELRGDLDTIVMMALRKEAERRYGTVQELSQDVHRYLRGLPVGARRDSRGYRLSKFIGRHRFGAATAAALLLALVLGLATTLWQARNAAHERDRARAEVEKTDMLNRFLTGMLTAPDPSRGSGRSITVASVLDQAAAHVDRDMSRQPMLAAALEDTLGMTYDNLGLRDEALRELEKSVATLRHHGGDPLVLADTLSHLGVVQLDAGHIEPAGTALHEALAIYPDRNSLGAANALASLADVERRAGDDATAERDFHAAQVALEALGPGHEADLATLYNNFALLYGDRGQPAQSEPLQRKAVTAARVGYGSTNPQYAQSLGNLAGLLDIEGKRSEAEPLYRESLALMQASLGSNHPATLQEQVSYANMLWLEGRYADAEPLARSALQSASKTLPAEHPIVGYAQLVLGEALTDLGRAGEAVPLLRATVAGRTASLPRGHWLIASARATLGRAEMLAGDLDAAERDLVEAHAALLANRGPQHEKTLLSAAWLAELQRRRNLPVKAHPNAAR
jgi:serine/threonine-protein kinase